MSICSNLIFFFCFLLASLSVSSIGSTKIHDTNSQLEKVAYSKKWLMLLHYQKRYVGLGKSYKSFADGKDFFFSVDGKTDPYKELIASINAFKDVKKLNRIGRTKAHPQCAFPARYRFLKKEFNLKVKDVPCPEVEAWVQGIGAKKMTLVFSSAFPFNPASLFGHTFFKFIKDEKKPLLDYILNFAATTGDSGNIEFALLGVFGGHEGHFSIMPYFLKITEYIHFESRDLYEYPLDLNEKEIQEFLYHIWELEATTYFDYYFFDENCSFMLIWLLETVRPSLDLVSQFPLAVLPLETVRSLEKSDLLSSPVYRPSQKKLLLKKLRNLTAKEKDLFNHFQDIDIEKLKSKLNELENSEVNLKVIDYAIDYYKWKKDKNRRKLSKDNEKRYFQLLKKRARFNKRQNPKSENALSYERPDKGHPFSSLFLSKEWQEKHSEKGFYRLRARYGFHDFYNDQVGQMPFQTIEFIWGELKYFNKGDKQIKLNELGAIHLKSINPYDGLNFFPSYHVKAFWTREDQLSAHFGLGPSLFLIDDLLAFYSMIKIHGTTSLKKEKQKAGLEAGLIYHGKTFNITLEYLYLKKLYFFSRAGTDSLQGTFSYPHAKNLELRGHLKYDDKNGFQGGPDIIYHF